MQVRYEIIELPPLHTASARHIGPYHEVGEAFERLFLWAAERGLLRFPVTRSLAVYHDSPETTEPASLRSDACITVPQGTVVDGGIALLDIPGGLYAVGHFEIDGSEFGAAWDLLTREFLPTSGHVPDDRPCYEVYLNDAESHPEKKFIVDICEPVRPAS